MKIFSNFSNFSARAGARSPGDPLLPDEFCARCGHGSPFCLLCERLDPILGGSIRGERYCHTFSPPGSRSCFQQQLDEDARRR